MNFLKINTSKVLLTASISSALFLGACASNKPAETATPLDLKNENTKIVYSLGALTAEQLKTNGFDSIMDSEAYMAGLTDGLKDSAKLDQMEMQNTLQGYVIKLREKQEAERQAAAVANAEAGKKFLAENAKKPGITTTESGLQYEILKEGKGAKPTATDMVKTHYEGKLTDGTIFDSSIQRGQPASFPVNGVIMCWQEALQLMPEGSKWKLYCPGDLAYGERGAGSNIGPNAVLTFEVELLEIVKEELSQAQEPKKEVVTDETKKENVAEVKSAAKENANAK